MSCPSCGAEESGNYCSRCGTRLEREDARCAACGHRLAPDALYCGGCGRPVAPRPRKPTRAYLPWIFSALALAAFAVALAIFVQNQSRPRGADGLITGGLPQAPREAGQVLPAPDGGQVPGSASGSAGGMPSAAEIAAMSPRQAADRLFDRSMTERETGDTAGARFFADMAVQAYGRVPVSELDADARFHLGLLRLLLDDPAAARREADAVLEREPANLYGLVLSVRAAEAAGDPAQVRRARERLQAAVASGESPDREPYAPHRSFLERELERLEGS